MLSFRSHAEGFAPSSSAAGAYIIVGDDPAEPATVSPLSANASSPSWPALVQLDLRKVDSRYSSISRLPTTPHPPPLTPPPTPSPPHPTSQPPSPPLPPLPPPSSTSTPTIPPPNPAPRRSKFTIGIYEFRREAEAVLLGQTTLSVEDVIGGSQSDPLRGFELRGEDGGVGGRLFFDFAQVGPLRSSPERSLSSSGSTSRSSGSLRSETDDAWVEGDVLPGVAAVRDGDLGAALAPEPSAATFPSRGHLRELHGAADREEKRSGAEELEFGGKTWAAIERTENGEVSGSGERFEGGEGTDRLVDSLHSIRAEIAEAEAQAKGLRDANARAQRECTLRRQLQDEIEALEGQVEKLKMEAGTADALRILAEKKLKDALERKSVHSEDVDMEIRRLKVGKEEVKLRLDTSLERCGELEKEVGELKRRVGEMESDLGRERREREEMEGRMGRALESQRKRGEEQRKELERLLLEVGRELGSAGIVVREMGKRNGVRGGGEGGSESDEESGGEEEEEEEEEERDVRRFVEKVVRRWRRWGVGELKAAIQEERVRSVKEAEKTSLSKLKAKHAKEIEEKNKLLRDWENYSNHWENRGREAERATKQLEALLSASQKRVARADTIRAEKEGEMDRIRRERDFLATELQRISTTSSSSSSSASSSSSPFSPRPRTPSHTSSTPPTRAASPPHPHPALSATRATSPSRPRHSSPIASPTSPSSLYPASLATGGRTRFAGRRG